MKANSGKERGNNGEQAAAFWSFLSKNRGLSPVAPRVPRMKTNLPPVVAVVILWSLIQMLVACMPVARDDFSTLENDALSNLIRNSHSEINLTPGMSSGSLGVGALDPEKAKYLANILFIKKNKNETIKLFQEYGGRCGSANEQEILRCEFTRRWKLKNIGAPFDANNWSDPSARFVFVFEFDKLDQVDHLNLSIINATEYKQIRDIK